MARDRNLIQNPELLLRLRRAMRIRGERTLTPTLNNGVQAVVVVDDLTHEKTRVDEVYARIAGTAPADVAATSVAGLENPAGSNVLLVVDAVAVSAGSPGATLGFGTNTGLGTALQGVPTHGPAAGFFGPVGAAPRVRGRLVTGTGAGWTAGSDILFRGSTTVWSQGIVFERTIVYPGDAIAVVTLVVNSELTTAWAWHETQLGQGAEPLV